MKITAKLRKIGNSYGILLPKNVITLEDLERGYIDIVITSGTVEQENVITSAPKVITSKPNVITHKSSNAFEFCLKHKGYKRSCGCK